jgi:hypothetical protein
VLWAAAGGWADVSAADGGDGGVAGGRLMLWVELTVRDVGELDPPQARAHGHGRRGPCALGRRSWSPSRRRRCGGADGAAGGGGVGCGRAKRGRMGARGVDPARVQPAVQAGALAPGGIAMGCRHAIETR